MKRNKIDLKQGVAIRDVQYPFVVETSVLGNKTCLESSWKRTEATELRKTEAMFVIWNKVVMNSFAPSWKHDIPAPLDYILEFQLGN